MSWFKNLLSGTDQIENETFLDFGRYSDAYKQHDKYDAWDKSIELFKQSQYLESYRHFFNFLEYKDNVLVSEVEDQGLNFEFYQGSKMVVGEIGSEFIRAEAKIAKVKENNLAFLRRLIESNFGLKYARYALDDENMLTIVFDSYLLDCSGFKLYFALKELALNADKLDDLLIDEFENHLEEVNTGHVLPISDAVAQVKYEYIKEEIQKTLDFFYKHEEEPIRARGGLSYVLLNTIYKIDYLTKPEGYIVEATERMQRLFFAKNEAGIDRRNEKILAEYKAILDRTEEQIKAEFYSCRFTFGITESVDMDHIRSIIINERNNFRWYRKNNDLDIALSVAQYIVGYTLFNFAPPQVVLELYHLFFRISENYFFKSINQPEDFYNRSTGALFSKQIKRDIREIENKFSNSNTHLEIQHNVLDFSDPLSFTDSFFEMILRLEID